MEKKTNEEPVPTHDCSKNHTGSSKSMEAIAGVKLLVEVAANGTPIARLVGDDDSSLSANMKHSYRVKIDSNLMAETDWPRGPPTAKNSKGTKKPDHGMLPISCPEVKQQLADPTHRTKCVGKAFFSHATKSKKENKENLTKQDCQRIKVNHGYFIKTHCHLPLKEMHDAAPSIINHHFNDHSVCGKWCPYSLFLPEEERKELSEEESKKRYRSKIVHLPMYEKCTALMSRFITRECLAESAHPYHSQTNEALNQSVATYAPKHKNYSKTPSLKCRVSFAAGVHSVSMKGFVSSYCERVGIKTNSATKSFLERRNNEHINKAAYLKKLSVKRKRSRGKKLKQKEAFKSERKETKQGITYETAYRMTSGDDEINEDNSDAEQGEQIDGVHLFYF
jgi:hypothetical protein